MLTQADPFAEFASGFRRSKRSHLWRSWEGLVLTVFPARGGEGFAFCIASKNGPDYSEGPPYESEADAIEGLWFIFNDPA